jgi:hypothetical protein
MQGFQADSPHLADLSAGVGTLSCKRVTRVAGGLPGFIGPFPSTSLDEFGWPLSKPEHRLYSVVAV